MNQTPLINMQNSWTKRAVEVDSPQPMSPSDQLADPSNSTCAQVIHPKAENYCDGWLPIAAQKECNGNKNFKSFHLLVLFTITRIPAIPASEIRMVGAGRDGR